MIFEPITCRTETCSWYNIVVPIEANGIEIVCSGECQNILRPDNPDHPNYPEPPEPEPTIDELIEQKLRELGVIP